MINISIAFDNNYSLPAMILFASILLKSNEKDKFSLFILDGGLSRSIKERFNKLRKIKDFNIKYVKIDDQVFKEFPLPNNGHFRSVNYYRIMIPLLIPDVEKILYLDCDMIVQRSLKSLFSLDISNFIIGAAKSVTSYKNNRRLGLPRFVPYINSGVLLINANKWRLENITDKLFDFISTAPNEKLLNVDQDAINAVLYDSIYLFDRRWNVETRTDIQYPKYYRRFLENPYISHYVSSDKPWLFGTKHDTSLINYYLEVIENLDP